MADVTPIRVVVDGSGDTTGLSEFLSGETLGLVHGGTGATTAAGAISSLGLHAVAVSGSYTDLLNKPTTDGITEGTTNLYYTDARVLSYLGTNSYVTQSYVDNAVSNILDGAPGVLDTLNELAAAIGDDANFITTINSSISTVQSNVDALFGSKSTSDLSEGTNLYYTNTRADDRIVLQVGTNLDLSNKSTTNLSEGTNLYFTDERVDDRVANLITDGVGITKSYDDVGNLLNIAIDFSEFDSDDIVEGAVNTFLNNKSTDDLSEGSTNLYFTNERVDDRVDSLIVGGTNISTTYSDLNNRLTFNLDTTGGITLTNNSTSDLPEGTNLYYTNARVDARVSAGISSNGIALESWVLSVTNPISANLSSEITRATNAESTISTNLTNEISRATAKENSIQSDLDDEIFDRETAISNLITTDIAEGTNLYYTDTRARGAISVTGDLTYDSATGIISTQGLASSTTDDLSEGTTNLYYTDSRARAAIDGQIVKFANMFAAEANLPSATTYHGMFAHVHATGKGYFAHAGAWIKLLDESSSTTTDITEGTNLYYTESRTDARIALQVGASLDLSNKTTSDLSEGTNLYYTQARFDTAFTAKSTTNLSEGTNLYYTAARDTAQFNTDLATKSTSDLSEGTNLYFTNARVQTKLGDVSGHIIPDTDVTYDLGSSTHKFRDLYLSGSSIILGTIELSDNGGDLEVTPTAGGTTNTFATTSYVTTAIANLVDTAPATLDTLNELAAALGDDASFSTTVTDSIALKLAITDFTSTANTWVGTKSTSDLSEGTNLYYTESRTDARISLQVGTSLDLSNKSTTDLTEGTNLYFTDARALAATDGQIVKFANMFAAEGNLPSATTYHGMFAHVHGTGKGYFAHAGSWIKLLDESSSTTTDLTEGTNLYYTDARVDARITNAGLVDNIGDLGDVNLTTPATNGQSLVWDNANSEFIAGDSFSQSDFNTAFTAKSTTNLSEGTNLYYTDARVDARVSATVNTTSIISDLDDEIFDRETADTDLQTQINAITTYSGFDTDFAAKSTTDLSEGTNLYYTDARALAATDGQIVKFANMFATVADLPSASTYHGMFAHVHGTNKGYFAHAGGWKTLIDESSSTTTDLSEGTNLYYTDSRVDARITNAGSVTQSDIDTAISDLVDSSPATLDTLNELAAALGDDANFSTTITNSIALKLNIADAATTLTDLGITDGTTGQLLSTDGSGTFSFTTPAAAGSSIEISTTAPSSPSAGDLWFDSSTLETYIYYNDGTTSQWVEASSGQAAAYINFDTDFAAKSTTDLSEGTNLYYTDSRTDARVALQVGTALDLSNKSTSDLSEGTNLYYTDARVQTKLGDVSGNIIPDTDVTYDLGSSTHKFKDLYLSGSSISLGTIELSDNGGALEVTPIAGGSTSTFATTTYVTDAIANLVDTAPTTLDTLNELAAALGDDANFSTTITNSIATKLATADFTSTANTWLTTKSTSDITEGTNLYYTDARVRTHITGADLDMGSNDITTTGKMLFANMYAATGDLPSATTYHGMFAHVHGTGKGYFAHAGSWVELANNSQIIAQDFSWASITGKPTTIAGYGITDAFDGTYASLTGAPTIPTSIDNLTNVDITTTAPTDGQTLVWDNANSKFIPGAAAAGAALQVSDAVPSNPTANDLWLNSTNMKLFVYYADGSSNQWVEVGSGGTTSSGSGGGSSVTVADAVPSSPSAGDMWFNSTDTKLYIYYNDGSSSQWVQALPSGGSSGSSGSSNTWVEKTAAYTVVAGEKLLVDCSSAAVTVTLPASATLGDEIRIIDATGNSSTNNITIARNGHKIQGASDDLTINTGRAAFGLVYYNAAQGWLLTER